jgi:hypothetical protein
MLWLATPNTLPILFSSAFAEIRLWRQCAARLKKKGGGGAERAAYWALLLYFPSLSLSNN